MKRLARNRRILLAIAMAGGAATILLCWSSVWAVAPQTFYVDPSTGSAAGDGSAARPWRTLQEVIEAKKIATFDKAGAAINPDAPVNSGDTIKLKSGYHGDVIIKSAYNTAPITITADTGADARVKRVILEGGKYWKINGLNVSPSYAPDYATAPLADHLHLLRMGASDSEATNNTIVSAPDAIAFTWTKAEWNSRIYSGVSASGERVIISGNLIRNVNYGANMAGDNEVFANNRLENMTIDGIRALGNYNRYENNQLKNFILVNDEHHDLLQSWSRGPYGVGSGVVKGVVIRGNVFRSLVDKDVPFVGGYAQGIGCFNGLFDGWTIENNVIVTNHWNVITMHGIINSRIANNTLIDQGPGDPTPWIKTTDWVGYPKGNIAGRTMENVVVANNIIAGSLQGQQHAGVVRTNNLAHQNAAAMAALFVDYAGGDYRLKPGSAAIDKGSAQYGTTIDITGLARTGVPDIGAYEFGATSTPVPATATPIPATPTPPPASSAPVSGADLTGDGVVNILDLSRLLSAWGKSGVGDINGDGTVGILDLSRLLTHWTALVAPSATPVATPLPSPA